MIWVNFLHIYQPANQVKEIFSRVVSESYLPLVRSLLEHPEAKLTLNINATLTERLEAEGYTEIIGGLRTASERGQIEFTDSAKYHALLPFLPEEEMVRQIELNRETNRRVLGDSYNPKGFFPPEMAYSPKLVPVLEKLGYEWLVVDEIAYNGKLDQLKKSVVGQISGTEMMVFFRERRPSNLIMSASVRREEDLKHYLADSYGMKDYMVTGMDGETFGHHRPGLQDLLTELLVSKQFEHAFFRDLPKKVLEREIVLPVVSTWASSEKDIEEGVQFISWDDPTNEIHVLQWELQKLALSEVKAAEEGKIGEAREKLDVGLASDQFFWASAKPWWSLEVIELGAWTLLDAIKSIPGVGGGVVNRANDLYLKILAKAFEWQRTGRIRELAKQMKETPRIPFKERTATEPWVYKAFIHLLKGEEKKAAEKGNFEEAILWRDAIWKLETKNDIFEAVHVVDLLRRQIPNTEILDVIDRYKKEYQHLVSGQPEQRSL